MAKKQESGFMNYEAWQMKRYGNTISPAMAGTAHTADEDLAGSGLEELNRLAEWIGAQSKPGQLFTINPPVSRIGRLRKKKWLGKLLYLSRNIRGRQYNKLILSS